MRTGVMFAIAAILAFLPSLAPAATYLVTPDGSGDFPNIQAAINAAGDGDTIELTDGTFTGPGNRDLTMYKRLTIRAQAGSGGNCIIDCQGSLANRHYGFECDDQAAGSLFQGLTIQNAYILDPGGAMSLYETSLTIDQCIFYNNYADLGGGAIYAATSCELQISDCVFILNRADQSGIGGGALYMDDGSTAAVSGSLFHDNRSANNGGGDAYCLFSDLTMTNCTLHATQGRALFLDAGSTAVLAQTMIVFGLHEAVRCAAGASATLSCCDVFGNAGGDWTGCLAGQESANGNISLDPLFCPDPSHPYYLCENSPCAPFSFPNDECDLIGAYPVYCGPHVYTVRPDGTGDFPNIQTALDGAWYGSIVELEDGTFTGSGNRDVVFPNKPVTLRSASGNPSLCVIDCQGSESDLHQAFIFDEMNMAWCVLENTGIRNAHGDYLLDHPGGAISIGAACSPIIRGCVFRNNRRPFGWGGAVAVGSPGAAPVIENCTFDTNEAMDGGAISCPGRTSIRVAGCTFSGNGSGDGGGCLQLGGGTGEITGCSFVQNTGGRGGAIVIEGGCFTLSDCVFSSNVAMYYGGAVRIEGYLLSQHSFTRCVFYGNQTTWEDGKGGAVSSAWGGGALFDQCRFIGNSAPDGGAIEWQADTLEVSRCTFVDNMASGSGGGIRQWAAFPGNSLTVSHSTFYHNASGAGASGLCFDDYTETRLFGNIFAFGYAGSAIECSSPNPSLEITCTDIYGNVGGDWVGCIADQFGQNGNISEDPLFCLDDNPAEPYTLHAFSPCAGEQNPECGLIGAWPVGCPGPVNADVLLIETADTAVRQALTDLGIPFDAFTGEDWTGLDLSPYTHVFVAIGGGFIQSPSVEHVAAYAANGGHLHIYGGSDAPPYAIGLDAYLLQNDINTFQWTQVTQIPHGRIVGLWSYLARSHNWVFGFQDWGATLYQTRPTDPDMTIAAVNGDGIPMLVSKSIGAGTFDLCINTPLADYYGAPSDYAWLHLTLHNMYDMTPGAVIFPAVEDVFTTSFMPDGNFGGATNLGVGSTDEWGLGFWRTYAKFDLEVVQGTQIVAATLWLDQYDTGPGQEGSPCSVHRVTAPWNEYAITWTNQASHAAEIVDLETVGMEGDSGLVAWDVTSLVQDWADGAADYGLVVRHQTEAGGGGLGHGWFRSNESPVPISPRILVTAAPPTTAVDGPSSGRLPTRLTLAMPAPNPTRGAVTVEFECPGVGPVTAVLLDVQGRVIRRLSTTATEGRGRLHWDGRSDNGVPAASGSYYIRLQAGEECVSKRFLVLR